MMTNELKSCCAISREQFATKDSSKEVSVLEIRTNKIPPDFVFIPGGTYVTGTTSNDPDAILLDGEAIRKEVNIAPFYLAKTPVTNSQFAKFIEATGYVTEAEKFGWSFVFHIFVTPEHEEDVIGIPEGTPWWRALNGANWCHPEGQHSTIEQRSDHPVVHVSWNDAQAYCQWANKRLPTEAEWEYAASSGLQQKFPWGNKLLEGGKHHANVWQGDFPNANNGEDGFIGTAPANAYEPNAFGLYTMIGNVWEWSNDTFHTRFTTFSPDENMKLIKGGSYLCHVSYCNRYRIAARTFNTKDSSTGHMGFRVAYDQ